MLGSKEIIIDDTYITFSKLKKRFKVIDIDKYKKELKGNLRIILINTRMEVIKVNLKRDETIEKVIGKNFYNPKDKLFHYIKNRKSNNVILYSIEKPMVLDRLMETGKISSIKPYEFMLLKKYTPKKNILFKIFSPKNKSNKRIVIHSDFERLFLLAIDKDELVCSKNIHFSELRELNNYIKLLKSKMIKDEKDEVELNFGNIKKDSLDKILDMKEVRINYEKV